MVYIGHNQMATPPTHNVTQTDCLGALTSTEWRSNSWSPRKYKPMQITYNLLRRMRKMWFTGMIEMYWGLFCECTSKDMPNFTQHHPSSPPTTTSSPNTLSSNPQHKASLVMQDKQWIPPTACSECEAPPPPSNTRTTQHMHHTTQTHGPGEQPPTAAAENNS